MTRLCTNSVCLVLIVLFVQTVLPWDYTGGYIPLWRRQDQETAAAHAVAHSASHADGGGAKQLSHRYLEQRGEKDHGHKSTHHHEKGKKGKEGKALKTGHYVDVKGQKHKHHDGDRHYGSHHEASKGHKGGKFGEKKEHKKGHKSKGYHNKFFKDEYHKEHRFYDDYNASGHHEKFGNRKTKYSKKGGGSHNGAKHDSGHAVDSHGKKGHHDKGHHVEDHKGHAQKHGHNDHHSSEKDYAKKGGHKGGKVYSFVHP